MYINIRNHKYVYVCVYLHVMTSFFGQLCINTNLADFHLPDVFICMYMRPRVYVCICIYIHIHIYVCVCTCIHMPHKMCTGRKSAAFQLSNAYKCIYIYKYIYIYIHTCIYMHIHVYRYIYIYTNMHIYLVHTYLHMSYKMCMDKKIGKLPLCICAYT